MKDYVKQYGEIIAILLALFLIIFTLFTRIQDSPAIAGDESYFNLRMAHELVNNYDLKQDDLQNRPYNFNLYHYFLTLFLFLPDQAIILTSIILTLISTYLLYLSLRANLNKEKSIIAIIVYILSPLYLYSAIMLTSFSLTIFLVIFSTYLYFRKNKYWMIPALLVTLIDVSSFLVFTLIVFIYKFQKEKDFEKPLILLILGVVITFVFMELANYTPIFNFNGGLSFTHYITDFGAVIGYSFFSLLLALVIIVLLWKKSNKNIVSNLAMVLLFFYTTLAPSSRFVFNIVISLYVMFALYYFIERKWIMDILKDLTILILISSLLFSSVSFAERLVNMEPSNDLILTLQTIKENNRHGIILTPENGFIMEYYTNKPVYLDGLSFIYSDYEEKLATSQEILNLKSPVKTKELLNKEGITFIYIDKEVREAKKGVVLVLELSENFIKLGEFNGKEAWLYLKI